MAKVIQKILPLEKLVQGMTILSIVGFDEEYRPLAEDRAAWVRLNFEQARLKVRRDTEEIQLAGNEVLVGDFVQQIDQLDQMDRSFKIEDLRLVTELGRRGFTLFIVETPAKSENLRDLVKQERVALVDRIIEKLDHGRSLSREASQQLGETFEALRQEKTDPQSIHNQVDSILANHGLEVLNILSLLEQNTSIYQHSLEVAALYHSIYFDFIARRGIKSSFNRRREVFLGAFVHDFGMARVPKYIYESKDKFERGSKEWKLLRQHPELGAQMLGRMGMPEVIVNMAYYHHVKLDGSLVSSYPEQARFNDALPETRLLGMMDIYQALTGHRTYSKTWTPPSAMRFLDALEGSEFDSTTWSIFLDLMGRYPIGSLVELNTGDLAFVVGQSPNQNNRPMLVPVKTAGGEELTHHQLILLETEEDLMITDDLRPQNVFGERALEVFSKIRLS
ncbi:MAG: HD domain-containing protein [bacterium]|nr:HD domain-containing protein [bacterium]